MGAVYRAADLGQGFKVKKFHVKEAVVLPIEVISHLFKFIITSRLIKLGIASSVDVTLGTFVFLHAFIFLSFTNTVCISSLCTGII